MTITPFLRLWLLALLVALLRPAAQDDSRVGLVIDFGDGQTTTRCVSFAEPEISGYEALLRSGLALEIDQQGSGPAVCRVEGTGCPADDCFCACPGGECVYWSYWHQRDGAWEYAVAGSRQSQVRDGDVDGWVWGPGSVTEAPPPPLVSFAEICAGEATTGAALSTAAPVADSQGGGATNPLTYVGLVGLLALLGGLGWLARRRERG